MVVELSTALCAVELASQRIGLTGTVCSAPDSQNTLGQLPSVLWNDRLMCVLKDQPFLLGFGLPFCLQAVLA